MIQDLIVNLKNNSFKVPPSIFNAYEVCPYQAWLMQKGIMADQQNTFIEIGRILDENTYKRDKKHIDLAGFPAKIDILSKDGGDYLIVEVKKTSKSLNSAIWQLKYYLYILEEKGLNFKAKLKIPEERKNYDVFLSKEDIETIENKLKEIEKIILSNLPPKRKRIKFCSACGHNEFCWA